MATRRLRAALRLFGDVLPAEASDVKDELKWIAGHLGAVRDLDVQVERLEANAAVLGVGDTVRPYAAWLTAERRDALKAFENAFASERFVRLTERLRCLSAVSDDSLPCEDIEDEAPGLVQRAYRQLKKRADLLTPDAAAADFHQARIRAKRLRYAAEFLEAALGKPARRLIKATTELQDLLGDHQDGIVSSQRMHAAVAEAGEGWPPETSVALGQVIQYETQRGGELRQAFKPLYRDVKDAWQNLRS